MYKVTKVDASHVVSHNGLATRGRFTSTTTILQLVLLLIPYITHNNGQQPYKWQHMTTCDTGNIATDEIMWQSHKLQYNIQGIEENQHGILMARKSHKNDPAQETKNEILQLLKQLTRVYTTWLCSKSILFVCCPCCFWSIFCWADTLNVEGLAFNVPED